MNTHQHTVARVQYGAVQYRSSEQGVATLTVVMVLFFIMALVAAYSSRNMVFEQRTATNQLRSTQALEAALCPCLTQAASQRPVLPAHPRATRRSDNVISMSTRARARSLVESEAPVRSCCRAASRLALDGHVIALWMAHLALRRLLALTCSLHFAFGFWISLANPA
jgi:hypothetical protein